MARILIDARKIRDYGIGTYIRELIAYFSSHPSGHRFEAIVLDRERAVGLVPTQWPVHPVTYEQYSIGELVRSGATVRRIAPDLLHVPHYNAPLNAPKRMVATIHDIIPLLFPQYWNAIKRATIDLLVRRALTNARLITTCSESTRRSLLDRYRCAPEKIVVTPYGISERYFTSGRRAELAVRFRQIHQLERPFILFVSNLKPHKGLKSLLRAYAALSSRVKNVDLVMTGGSPDDLEILTADVRSHGISDRVRLLGRIPDEDVPAAYAAADLFVLPSLYEGFGFPVLEAMAAGTPVVCSNGGSLPEVAGDAAVIYERGDADALAHSLQVVLEDSVLRQSLRTRGLVRAAEYTWQRTATMTLDCYARALG